MKRLAFALSILGMVSWTGPTFADSFLYNNGTYTIINVPGANYDSTVAEGINDMGQIVGHFTDSTGNHGFLDVNGHFTQIDFPGSSNTGFSGINNAGEIVGGYEDSSPQGFLYTNGVFSPVNFPGNLYDGTSAINNLGQITGSVQFRRVAQHGFLYSNGGYSLIILPFTNSFSEAHGINDSGQIVGVYFAANASGFLDTNGVFSSISVPNSDGTYAYGINNSGQIVGFFAEQNHYHGFVDTNGVFTSLDVPRGSDTIANGINNEGEIVGSFTPSGRPSSPVPEPGSVLLLVSGFAAIGIKPYIKRILSRNLPSHL